MSSSYQVVLWKQDSLVVLRLLQIEFFRSLLELPHGQRLTIDLQAIFPGELGTLLSQQADRKPWSSSFTMTVSGAWSSPTKLSTTSEKKTEWVSNISGDTIERGERAARA
jgi:hypothetical protein